MSSEEETEDLEDELETSDGERISGTEEYDEDEEEEEEEEERVKKKEKKK